MFRHQLEFITSDGTGAPQTMTYFQRPVNAIGKANLEFIRDFNSSVAATFCHGPSALNDRKGHQQNEDA
jgi:hypothetical protein